MVNRIREEVVFRVNERIKNHPIKIPISLSTEEEIVNDEKLTDKQLEKKTEEK
jgi:hypothetical protein